MKRKCLVCGAEFTCSPTTKKVTCSAKCKKIRRSQLALGHTVSDEAKKRIKASAKGRKSESLAKGTEHSIKSPYGGKGELNASAKSFTLLSPEGKTYTGVNLRNWVRANKEIWGIETDEEAERVSNGLRVIKHNIKLNRRGQTYKGWTFIDYSDDKNCEVWMSHPKSNNIRTLRVKQSLTLTDLYKLTGISIPNLKKLEDGIRETDDDILLKIANALKCRKEDLI